MKRFYLAGMTAIAAVPAVAAGSYDGALRVISLGNSYVGYESERREKDTPCHDLILSEKMKHRVDRTRGRIFKIKGAYVTDYAEKVGVSIQSINGRRWSGRICPLEPIFVDKLSAVGLR